VDWKIGRKQTAATDALERAEVELENAHVHAAQALSRVMRERLIDIHARTFHRHALYFLDAMGSAGVDIIRQDGTVYALGSWGQPDDRRLPVFAELDALLTWYAGVCDDMGRITADAVQLPARTDR